MTTEKTKKFKWELHTRKNIVYGTSLWEVAKKCPCCGGSYKVVFSSMFPLADDELAEQTAMKIARKMLADRTDNFCSECGADMRDNSEDTEEPTTVSEGKTITAKAGDVIEIAVPNGILHCNVNQFLDDHIDEQKSNRLVVSWKANNSEKEYEIASFEDGHLFKEDDEYYNEKSISVMYPEKLRCDPEDKNFFYMADSTEAFCACEDDINEIDDETIKFEKW